MDTAYGSSDNLVWLTLKRQILPLIPVFDTSKRKGGTWSRADYTWAEGNNRWICPEGKEFRHTRRSYSDPARNTHGLNARNYGALKSDCQICPSQVECGPDIDTRPIPREKYETVKDLRISPPGIIQRPGNVEKTRVAPLKRILGLEQLRLRGPSRDSAAQGPAGQRMRCLR